MNHHTPAVVDGVAIGEVARRVLEPGRLAEMLRTYVKAARPRPG
jgi:hypothetical protein